MEKGNLSKKHEKVEVVSTDETKIYKQWRCNTCSSKFLYRPKKIDVERNYFNCVDCFSPITVKVEKVR